MLTHAEPGALRGRRSGHPRHRTLCDLRRSAGHPPRTAPFRPVGSSPRSATPSCSRWRGVRPCSATPASAAGCATRTRPAADVPRPAPPVRLQQAAPALAAYDRLAGRVARRRHCVGDDDRVGGPLHPRRVRPLPRAVTRSDLAGWAQYGYCASHSRFFWGLRLHLLCTLHGLPVGWALTGAKADERHALIDILATTPTLVSITSNPTSSATRTTTAPPSKPRSPTSHHPAPAPRNGETHPRRTLLQTPPPDHRSVNDTLKGQLDLNSPRPHHRLRPPASLNASSPSPQPSGTTTHRPTIPRSLITYDH